MKKLMYIVSMLLISTWTYAQSNQNDQHATNDKDTQRGLDRAGDDTKRAWKNAKKTVNRQTDRVSSVFSGSKKDFETSWDKFETDVDKKFADFEKEMRELYDKRNEDIARSMEKNGKSPTKDSGESWDDIEEEIEDLRENVKSEYKDLREKETKIMDGDKRS